MKSILKTGLIAAAAAGLMGASFVVGQATADQPHMRNALDALGRAKTELMIAEPDKGGHRLAAINAVNRAILETRAGMEYAQ